MSGVGSESRETGQRQFCRKFDWCVLSPGHRGQCSGYIYISGESRGVEEVSPAPTPRPDIEKLLEAAEEAKKDNPDPGGTLHRKAESCLSIAYDEEGKWRINYTLPRKAVIAINNRQPALLAMAQIRGMLADFAGRELDESSLGELKAALREIGNEIGRPSTNYASNKYQLDEHEKVCQKISEIVQRVLARVSEGSGA